MEQKEAVMVLFDREEEYARSIHTQRWRNCWNGRKMGR